MGAESVAFFKYLGTVGPVEYPTYGNMIVSPGDVVDFGAVSPPVDGLWQANAGPATSAAVPVAPSAGVPLIAAPLDGQVAVWSVAKSAYVPTSVSSFSIAQPAVPAGAGQLYGTDVTGAPAALNHQLAYAEDVSGLAYLALVNGTPTNVYGCVINVPATPRNVAIRYQVPFTVTAAGNGSVNAAVYEVTTGSAVLIDNVGPGGSFLTGVGSNGPVARGEIDLGKTTTDRQFVLAGLMFLDGSSTLAAKIKSNTTYARAYIKAVAE